MRFQFLYLMLILLLYADVSGATMDPWYSVQDTNNFEINVYFEGSSLEIKPYYKFHLGLMGEILKANPELSLVINHGGRTSFSLARSQRLYFYFSNREGVPLDKIFIYEGLSPRYSAEKGERLLVYLKEIKNKKKSKNKPEKKLEKIDEAVVQKEEGPVKIDSDKYIVEPEGETEVYEILESEDEGLWSFEAGLGYREYNFQRRSKFSSYVLDFKVGYQAVSRVQLKLDLEAAVPDVNDGAGVEYDIRFGLDTVFESVELESRLYHKSNFIWRTGSASGFDMVSDYGLSQKIDFKLFRISSSVVKIGFFGEVSFSNNFSSVDSANTYKYSTDFQILFPQSNIRVLMYFSTQEYKTNVEVSNVDIFGLSLFYTF